jgi:predicted nucleic acid-binding protein
MESRLSSSSTGFVVDTSAIININASQCGPQLLKALPLKLMVVDIAAAELETGRQKGRRDAAMLIDLRDAGLVDVVALGDGGEALFERLVVGPAHETLDDGEAATIAYAVEHSLGVVVDDSKARRMLREQFGHLIMSSSVELLQHPALASSLGKDGLAAAVLSALRTGRMRVLPEHISWVVDLIGDVDAASCPSLPKRSRVLG